VTNEETIAMGGQPSTHTPVTYDNCGRIEGPFYHGTESALAAGAEFVPGYGSNLQQGRVPSSIYFTALVETAAWGAELATALAGTEDRGHVHVVEPMGGPVTLGRPIQLDTATWARSRTTPT
jgi:Rifampin ADP-ribosyl transferase